MQEIDYQAGEGVVLRKTDNLRDRPEAGCCRLYLFIVDKQQFKALQISKGAKNFLRDLDAAQIMLLQGYILGILFADNAGITTFEKNLKIEKHLERCFEVPYYFFSFSKTEALERVIECFSP